MNYQCGYNGIATAALINATPVWTRTDDKVHVSAELLDDPQASAEIGLKYDAGAWCDEVQAFHATLIEETS